MLVHRFCFSRKGGTGEGGWGAAARLGFKSNMVRTEWANSHPGCMSRLRKRYSLFRGFISGREGFLGSKWVFAY